MKRLFFCFISYSSRFYFISHVRPNSRIKYLPAKCCRMLCRRANCPITSGSMRLPETPTEWYKMAGASINLYARSGNECKPNSPTTLLATDWFKRLFCFHKTMYKGMSHLPWHVFCTRQAPLYKISSGDSLRQITH